MDSDAMTYIPIHKDLLAHSKVDRGDMQTHRHTDGVVMTQAYYIFLN
jgi:hypothetical protein